MAKTLDQIRADGERDIAAALALLDARHKQLLLDAIKRYGNVRNIPDSVWQQIADDTGSELAAAALLIVADADDYMTLGFANAGVRTFDLTPAEMAAYSVATTRRADQAALDSTNTLRDRLDRKVQDEMLTGEGAVGTFSVPGLELAVDGVLSGERRIGFALDETTDSISQGQIGARDRTVGDDGAAETTDGQEVSIELIWRVHPERSRTGPCPRCAPLEGQPEEVWEQIFPEGPGPDAHPGCVCTLDFNLIYLSG